MAVTDIKKECLETVTYTSSSAQAVGTLVRIAGIGVGRAIATYGANVAGEYQIEGIVECAITSAVTVAQGDVLVWDVSAGAVNLATAAQEVGVDFICGVAERAGTAAGGYVRVILNAGARYYDAAYSFGPYAADNVTYKIAKMINAGIVKSVTFNTSAALGSSLGIDIIDGGTAGAGTDVIVACTDNLNGVETKAPATAYVLVSGNYLNVKFDDNAGTIISNVTVIVRHYI